MSFDRRILGGGAHALVSTTLEGSGFLVAFSERTGGVSEGVLSSLNLSYAAQDDPASVARNREHLISGLRIPEFAVARQVHGTRIVPVGAKRAGQGFGGDTPVGDADGLTTTSANVPLAALIADCMPIVLASAQEGRLAVVHAGWRGMAAGIVSAGVGLFEDPAQVEAAIGPSIRPCHYEVGEDVALAVSAASDAGAVTERRGGRLFLDLPGTALTTLRAAGLRRVEDTGLCTACESDRFFSHRREGPTGRQAAIGMRLPGRS